MIKKDKIPAKDFWNSLDEAVLDCMKNGAEYQLTAGVDEQMIEIHISRAGKATKGFNDLLQKAVKDAVIMNKGGV